MFSLLKEHHILTWEDFLRLKVYAPKVNEYLFYDLETDRVFEKTANIYGIGMYYKGNNSFYIPIRHPGTREKIGDKFWTPAQEKEITEWINEELKSNKVVGHNIIYDVLVWLWQTKFDATKYVHADTIMMKHTLLEEGLFALKDLAVLELGEGANQSQQDLKEAVLFAGGKWNKEDKDMYTAPSNILGHYCMIDVVLTKRLFDIYENRLKQEELYDLFYKDEVMPFYKLVVINMKKHGIHINVEFFKKLFGEITKEIDDLKEEILVSIEQDVAPFVNKLLDKEVPIKNSGNFPKAAAEILGIPLPIASKKNKETGEIKESLTLAAKAIEKQKEVSLQYTEFYDWILGNREYKFNDKLLREIQKNIFLEEGQTSVFNIASNDHLAYYFFELKGMKPLKTTETGKKSVDSKFLDQATGNGDENVQKILDYKKLQKIKSTYIESMLEKQYQGVIYASFLAFGTTSARLSCTSPNLQQLPRPKDEESNLSPRVLKYVNSIRAGFIPKKGHVFLDTDYESLEIVCFSHVSKEPALLEIFKQNLDFYSKVAIDILKLNDTYSANKKADNFLKKHKPEIRQKFKPVPLGLTYGMEEHRLQQTIGVDRKEATKIINTFFGNYPYLKKYMQDCDLSAKKNGYVKNQFGRIRHLPKVKELYDKYGNQLLQYQFAAKNNLLEERRTFKQGLNNSKNFPIQSLASGIINRASIVIAQKFEDLNLDAYIVLQIHDQLVVSCAENIKEICKLIIRQAMEETTILSIPLIAIPAEGTNLIDGH